MIVYLVERCAAAAYAAIMADAHPSRATWDEDHPLVAPEEQP